MTNQDFRRATPKEDATKLLNNLKEEVIEIEHQNKNGYWSEDFLDGYKAAVRDLELIIKEL